MTIDQAKSLTTNDHVHYTGKHDCTKTIGPRGGVTVKITDCRVNGAVKTWKRDPDRVHVPVKYGLYEYASIDEWNLGDWHLASDCPIK